MWLWCLLVNHCQGSRHISGMNIPKRPLCGRYGGWRGGITERNSIRASAVMIQVKKRCQSGRRCHDPTVALTVDMMMEPQMNTWARSVKAGTIAALPKLYADDAGVLNKDSVDINVALNFTGCFARVTQHKLNVGRPKLGAPRQLHCNQQEISS